MVSVKKRGEIMRLKDNNGLYVSKITFHNKELKIKYDEKSKALSFVGEEQANQIQDLLLSYGIETEIEDERD